MILENTNIYDNKKIEEIFKSSTDEINKYVMILKENGININFEESIKNVYKSVKEKIKNSLEINDTILTQIENDIRKKKYTWFSYEIGNNNSAFSKDMESAKKLFEEVDSITIKKCDNFYDYMEKEKEKLIKWKSSLDYGLIKFPYLKEKRIQAQKTAFETDVKYFIFKEIVKESKIDKKDKKNNTYNEMINGLVDIPTDSTNREKLKNDVEIKLNYNNMVEYKFNKKDIELPIKESGISIVEESIFKVLNDIDISVFDYILKQKDITFFETGQITICLKDICQAIYKKNTTQYKKEIISSIIRISRVTVSSIKIDKDITTGFMMSLIYPDIKFENISGKTYITVIVGQFYREEIIKGNTIKVYSFIEEAVSTNKDAKKMLYFLQRERILLHFDNLSKNQDVNKLIKTSSYEIFFNCIYFTTKRKDIIISRIKKALNVIKNTNSILLDFSNKGDYFTFEFAPLLEEEIANLNITNLQNHKSLS